ncbi:MAG: site-specific integrase, partial [Gammaproteobacteria bacterium]|nr:site-specific integrase [Gammaproteobacteria bacterium]
AYEFLLTHQNNPATFNSYRREVERLLLWCESIARLPLSAIDEEAFKRYMTFCQHPPMSWIGHKKVHRFVTKKTGRVPNPDWRPFFKPSLSDDANTAIRTRVGPAKPTIQHLLAILQTFFTFLQRQGYLSHNPVTGYYRSGAAKLKQGTPPSSPKCITQTQWNKLLLAAEQLAHEQPMIHERTLFILTIIHTLQLRPSALVA